MPYNKTIFVDDNPPAIDAAELNKIGNQLETNTSDIETLQANLNSKSVVTDANTPEAGKIPIYNTSAKLPISGIPHMSMKFLPGYSNFTQSMPNGSEFLIQIPLGTSNAKFGFFKGIGADSDNTRGSTWQDHYFNVDSTKYYAYKGDTLDYIINSTDSSPGDSWAHYNGYIYTKQCYISGSNLNVNLVSTGSVTLKIYSMNGYVYHY